MKTSARLKIRKRPGKKPSKKRSVISLQILRPDAQWIRARRRLLRQVKEEVAHRLGPEPEDLIAYAKEYERELAKRWKISSKAELIAEIERADIVYGGDFHALGSTQRTHLKILRSLSNERPVILALEAFSSHAQKWLDAYLKGELEVEELRRKSKWDVEWGFPWENYRPLLEIAKHRGFRLLALSQPRRTRDLASLEARDLAAAKWIRQAYLHQPGALIYVVFGDLHLAPGHLPAAVKKQLSRGDQLRDLTIHMNSERIYFQLARKGLELSVDVVKLDATQYCVMSSPPWVQWQSYLLFLEQTADQDLEEEEGGGAAGDGEDSDFDPTDQVSAMVRLVARDLGLEFKLDDLAVYSSDDDRIWKYLDRRLKTRDRGIARQLLGAGRSFFIPAGGVGYLSRPTVNHAAHLAGQYIHARLCGRHRPLWNFPADFRALIWSEAVAFFVSKIVNHKRQSETLSDLRARLAVTGPSDERSEALRLALDHRMSEMVFLHQGRRRRTQVLPRRRASYLEAARILGGMTGERLYLAYRSRKLTESDIVQLMKYDVAGRGFSEDYENIIRILGRLTGSFQETGRGRGAFSDAFGGAFEGIKSKKERL